MSPPGSKIPRPTSSLSSSRRSSAASSPEPERVRRFSPPGLGAESQTGPQYSPTVSPTDMGRSRSGSGSISTLVERSLKAIPKGPPHTPTLAERAPTDSSPAVPRLRSRTDSESERGSDVPVFGGAEEEQVVLSYEEYWRTQQEVRLVRMMLLKLKKELQEGEGSPCALTGGTSTVSEVGREYVLYVCMYVCTYVTMCNCVWCCIVHMYVHTQVQYVRTYVCHYCGLLHVYTYLAYIHTYVHTYAQT